jgi:hypothetical protein
MGNLVSEIKRTSAASFDCCGSGHEERHDETVRILQRAPRSNIVSERADSAIFKRVHKLAYFQHQREQQEVEARRKTWFDFLTADRTR